MNVSFYCVNCNNNDRRSKMIERFSNHNIKVEFVNPVYTTDEILNIEGKEINKIAWSMMLNHLGSMKHFLDNTDNEYLIVCEDDILISKNIMTGLSSIIKNFKELALDVLLLGYLINFKLDKNIPFLNFPIIKDMCDEGNYTYYGFPDDLWGAQMYLIHRKHCEFLLNKYTIHYALENLNRPFSPDWTLTKDGVRGMIYPMIGVEEGDIQYECQMQLNYHRDCFYTNYDKDIFF